MQFGDGPVLGAELFGQLPGSSQAHCAPFDIHQQRRAVQRLQRRPLTQAAIGQYQQALMLAGFLPLALFQPITGLLQSLDQRRAAAGAELFQPVLQLRGCFLSLP